MMPTGGTAIDALVATKQQHVGVLMRLAGMAPLPLMRRNRVRGEIRALHGLVT